MSAKDRDRGRHRRAPALGLCPTSRPWRPAAIPAALACRLVQRPRSMVVGDEARLRRVEEGLLGRARREAMPRQLLIAA